MKPLSTKRNIKVIFCDKGKCFWSCFKFFMKSGDFAVGNSHFTLKTLHVPSENCKYMEIHICALEVEFHNSYNIPALSDRTGIVSLWSNYTCAQENISFHRDILSQEYFEC